ncbi:MAG TPA: class I SAM-dependent methyltransferase [Ilumatobacteraceae bacterium]|nr:class I SAM-dependent methyltransferase [Ilumatobacteraceae bacterium]
MTTMIKSTTADPTTTNPNKALREQGDFTRLAETMRTSGEEFIRRLDLSIELDVLDLGCGDGTTAIPAAQAGGDVRGIDIAAPGHAIPAGPTHRGNGSATRPSSRWESMPVGLQLRSTRQRHPARYRHAVIRRQSLDGPHTTAQAECSGIAAPIRRSGVPGG